MLSYSKSQRNGIICLVLLILLAQSFIFFVDFDKSEHQQTILLPEIQQKIDSLSKITDYKKRKVKPFNPNYLSDYKAYQLGLSVAQINRLFEYRKTGKYINSAKDFKEVTNVSDSLLRYLTPSFKFPKRVFPQKLVHQKKIEERIIVKDINKANQNDLIRIRGIGVKRAQSIVKYRKLLGGYSFDNQLDEVWGIPANVLIELKKRYKVISKPILKKVNVNKATVNELNKVVYINYKQAQSIIDYRNEVAEIQNLAELKSISNFPVDKFDLISLYLQAQ
ncbi:helix-hairpin-helix domain-containing protein [Wenyingzhuangia sp. IMCC45533]